MLQGLGNSLSVYLACCWVSFLWHGETRDFSCSLLKGLQVNRLSSFCSRHHHFLTHFLSSSLNLLSLYLRFWVKLHYPARQKPTSSFAPNYFSGVSVLHYLRTTACFSLNVSSKVQHYSNPICFVLGCTWLNKLGTLRFFSHETSISSHHLPILSAPVSVHTPLIKTVTQTRGEVSQGSEWEHQCIFTSIYLHLPRP